MKKNYLLLLITTLFFLNSYAQTCGFDIERAQLRQDPSYIQLEKVAEQRIQEAIEKRSLSKRSGAPIEVLTIPVVMHVLHLGEAVGTGINISDAQIQSSINNLNDFYRGQTAGSSLDFGVEFILAKRDPSNNATDGINRINASSLAGYSDHGVNVKNSNGASYSDIIALSNWPQTDYFNIWIVSELDGNDGGFGYQGYAYFYNEASSFHGSVMMASVFGYDPGNTNGWGLNSNGDNSTVVHELGHYFHLHHTFQGDGDGSACPADATVGGDSDGCDDTVPHKRETSTCPTVNSCNNSANWVDDNTKKNLMSYYNCTDRMTADQKTRVRAAMEATSIVSSKGGIVPDPTYVAPVTAECSTNTGNLQNNASGILSVTLNDVTFSSSGTANDNGNIDRSASPNNYFEINTENTNTINVGVYSSNFQQLGVWIDWNDDGDFNDDAEQQYLEEDIAANSTIQHQITYPTNIPYDDYVRIRLITDLDDRHAGSLINSACYDSLEYGQSEDYALYIEPAAVSTWTGANTDWATATNWSSSTVPIAASILVIPDVPNQPTIGSETAAVANNITIDANATLTMNGGGSLTIDGNLTQNGAFTINSGSSLIVSGTSAGDITYNLAIPDTNWHLVSSPVVGETYDDAWITANAIVSGTGNNRGISTYDNGTPNATTLHWRYSQAGSTAAFTAGGGYANLRTASGNYSFTGAYPTADVTPAISQNDKKDNLIGNPYPSYLDIGAFITANTANMTSTHQAVYVWNGATYTNLTTGYIHPGQGFFISSNIASGTASITEAMQSHNSGSFYRTNNPTINLTLFNGVSSKEAAINYLEGKTIGLDPRFDIGMFKGVASDLSVFTHLIEGHQEVAFETQALPNTDLESMIVPVGVKANANEEITFSLNAFNFAADLKIFLEDSLTNTYTRLDEANSTYTITTTKALNGIGRFYLHTSRSSLSVDEVVGLENVSMFKTDARTLRITGLQNNSNTNVTLFNLTGKQVFNTSFKSNGVKDIAVPKLATGVYVVKLKTDTGMFSKKIILE